MRIQLIIYITAIIGIIGAVQHWAILLNKFGNIANIVVNAPKIYRMRVEGQLHGMVPYITSTLNVSIFFSGIYTARTGRFSLGVILAFLGVILDDIASLGREGMIFAFFEFVSVVLVYRMFRDVTQMEKRINRKIIIVVITFFCVVLFSATLIKSIRSGSEQFKGSSRQLNRYKKGTLISPSIYLYFSSELAVLNKYLEIGDDEAGWGENTFLPIYNIIAKTGIIKKPRIYQRGYYVPTWTNTGTYLRELHADFGFLGVLSVPLLIGFIITYLWLKYHSTRNPNLFALLIYFLVLLQISFLMMITRSGKWWISLILIYIIINIDKIARIINFSNKGYKAAN